MILTEYGLHFAKEGDHWRCVEHPDLAMLRGGGYRGDDRTFTALFEALRQVVTAHVMTLPIDEIRRMGESGRAYAFEHLTRRACLPAVLNLVTRAGEGR